jgi:aconitate hydratase
VHPQVKANWLASPPLVVAFALAGNTRSDLTQVPLGNDGNGKPVYLADIWPGSQEIAAAVAMVNEQMFRMRYADVFKGDAGWQGIAVKPSATYHWDEKSTYVRNPPYFDRIDQPLETIADIENARALAVFGDSITTDHISPAGSIKRDSPAGKYLREHGVEAADFNSYGSRRGNHEVMMRGTFANIRIRNQLLGGEEGPDTLHLPSGDKLAIYDAAMRYAADKTPLIIVAGKEYGTGSSRDWAAKGTQLLGVKAVIAESFERIHRSNLVGFGVLPLQFIEGQNRATLELTGREHYSIRAIEAALTPGAMLTVEVAGGTAKRSFMVRSRIDTLNEIDYFRNGGILHYVLREMLKS